MFGGRIMMRWAAGEFYFCVRLRPPDYMTAITW